MLYCKESHDTSKLIGHRKIYQNVLTSNFSSFMSQDGKVEQPIESSYVFKRITVDSTYTKIPIPSEFFNGKRYVWIDMSHSFIFRSWASYPVCYSMNNSWISTYLSLENKSVEITHSSDWGNWEAWITMCCSA